MFRKSKKQTILLQLKLPSSFFILPPYSETLLHTHWFIFSKFFFVCVCVCIIIKLLPAFLPSFCFFLLSTSTCQHRDRSNFYSRVSREVGFSHLSLIRAVNILTWQSHFTHLFAVSKQHLAQLVYNCHFLALDLFHVRFKKKKKRTFWTDFVSGTSLSSFHSIWFSCIWENSKALLTDCSWYLLDP